MPSSNGDDDSASMLLLCMVLLLCCSSMCSSSSSLAAVMGAPPAGAYGSASGVWKKTFAGTTVQPGEWQSKDYGTMKNPTRAVCPSGSYVTDVMGFYDRTAGGDLVPGQERQKHEHTNALQAWCWNPSTQKATRLFAKTTCGKRDRPKVSNVFTDAMNPLMIALGGLLAIVPGLQGLAVSLVVGGAAGIAAQAPGWADAQKSLLKGGYGRAVYDYKFMAAPAGVYKWAVRPKDGEIQGLNMYGLAGEELGWVGGNRSTTIGAKGPRSGGPTGTISIGTCPKGKIVTGISASCGDRVDGLSFICDVPPGTK